MVDKEERTVSVPLDWLVGEPTVVTESCTYQDDEEFIPSIANHYGFEMNEVDVEFLEYHGWLTILVLKLKRTRNVVAAYLLIERSEYYCSTIPEVERAVATALIHHTSCHTEY